LLPPFAGGYPITSQLDHLSPDYGWDDTVVIYTGEQANAIDGIWKRTPTFRGGYWQPESERLLYYDGHDGTDYALPRGTTVLAAAPGEVVFAGSAYSGCDTPLVYVCLEHEAGYRTYYVHLDAVVVRAGQQVQAGDPVGISGNSGCSTGAHLHFSVETAGRLTDPYGWDAVGRPDPLLVTGGETATWLWAAGAPPTTPLTNTLTGSLTSPRPDTHTNGDLLLAFEPDPGCPPLARVEFWAYYTSKLEGDDEPRLRWHRVGVDRDGADGWALRWDTRHVPEGPVWLHAWAVDEMGRVDKGSPIQDSVTVDRHPPLGRLVGLQPGGTAGRRLWLYVTAEDPGPALDSTGASVSSTELAGVREVALLARRSLRQTGGPTLAQNTAGWMEIGQAERLHDGEWLFQWEPAGPPLALADGDVVDLVARLTDRAGNSTLTQPVEGIVLDDSAPLGQVDHPPPGSPLTTTVDLVYVPAAGTAAGLDRVDFFIWYDDEWHAVGADTNGLGGWQLRWDPAQVDDQAGIRVLARPQVGNQPYTALPQVTGLVLDRTPPTAGYIRPRTQGVVHPDVTQRVWAADEGSGVARVEFYRVEGEQRTPIGEDDRGEDGWSLEWDAAGVPDGLLDFVARVTDRAGNATWTEVQREVALDRTPPSGTLRVEAMRADGAVAGATHTLSLDVTDEVSGLDRAIFYARPEEGGWRHLGIDGAPRDGLRLRWDSTSLGVSGSVTLTAWVYDRAGNHVELPQVGGIWIEAAEVPPPTPTASGQASPSPAWTPTRGAETPPQPALPPVQTVTPASQNPTVTATLARPETTAAPTATASSSAAATAVPTRPLAVTKVPPGLPVPADPRLDTLVVAGVLAALSLFLVAVWVLARSRPR